MITLIWYIKFLHYPLSNIDFKIERKTNILNSDLNLSVTKHLIGKKIQIKKYKIKAKVQKLCWKVKKFAELDLDCSVGLDDVCILHKFFSQHVVLIKLS